MSDVDEKIVPMPPKDEAGVIMIGEVDNEKEDVKAIIQDETLFTEKENTKLLRKIDLHMLPFLCCIYGLQYVDKVTLSSGILFGLTTDTNLVGNDFAWLTTIFYLGNLFFQFPINWAMQRVPIGRFLQGTVIVWGILVMCLAACNSFAGLMVVRFLLGIVEGAVSPGFMLLTGTWYKGTEMTRRQLIYNSMNSFFTIWCSVVIYFLALYSTNHGGISGWRSINLFLGSLTVFVGILSTLFMGSPSEVRWLTPVEKRAAHARILSNGAGSGETQPWKWEQAWDAFKDPNTWFITLISFTSCIPNGGLTTFGTLIYTSFGFSNLDTILYQLPATALGIVAFCVCLVCTWKWKRARFPLMLFCQVPPIVALLAVGLLPASTSYMWTKWGLYMMVALFALPIFIAWSMLPTLIAGRTKRSVSSGIVMVAYCVGNCVGSQTFQASDAPRYVRGLVATAVVMVVEWFIILGWLFYILYENKRRAKVLESMGITEEERELQNKVQGELDVTDNRNIYFVYQW